MGQVPFLLAAAFFDQSMNDADRFRLLGKYRTPCFRVEAAGPALYRRSGRWKSGTLCRLCRCG
jgi:hypothetical protein